MKSPWHIGLLALAVTGVSAYDFFYFTQGGNTNQPSSQAAATAPLIASSEPMNSTPAESYNSTGAADAASLPRVSREEMQKLAQEAFVSREDWETESEMVWPRRDPFSASRESAPASQNLPLIPPAKETSTLQSLPAPQCIFSGTLIDQEHRLALVDGVPLSIGDRLGVWQLARIESDYIILEAGKESRRIGLKGAELQSSRRKDPS
jgi:hypothetical protein